MKNKPSPVVKHIPENETDKENRPQWIINKIWVGMAQRGNKRYRQQIAQDIAWYIRKELPLPIELHDYLLVGLDAMAEGAQPSEVFPTIEKKMRVDRAKRFTLFCSVEKLRVEEELTIDEAIERHGELQNIQNTDVDEYDKWVTGTKNKYERERTEFNKFTKIHNQELNKILSSD